MNLNDIPRENYRLSFTAGTGIDKNGLASLLSSPPFEGAGFKVADYISHIYIENPFKLNLDNREERLAKESVFQELVDVIKSFDLEPVFVFDYTCFGDEHLTADYQKKIGKLLVFLDSCGVGAISIADLYLAKMFTADSYPYSRFNRFRVFLSPYAKINQPIKLRYLENLRYDVLTVHHDLAREKDELIRMVKFAGAGKIEILLNSGCFQSCPFEIFCHALRFHVNEEPPVAGELEKKIEGYYNHKCSIRLRENPEKALELPIIYPPEVPDYIEQGIRHFRILNNPDSIEDLKEKVIPYLTFRNPKFPFTLIAGREEVLKGRFGPLKEDFEKRMSLLNRSSDILKSLVGGGR